MRYWYRTAFYWLSVRRILAGVARLTFKYRLYPTAAQVVCLTGELREACSLYNAALEERIGAYKTCRKSINYYDQANQLKAMRADGCLTLSNFSCCQDVLRRLNKTFAAFFARCKRGDKPGFPRFKSHRRFDSITFPSYGDGCRLLDNGKLRIQGAGHIKGKLHRPVDGKIKTVTLKREAGKWFVCFSVEHEPTPMPPSDAEIGIDVGLTHFATLSDGKTLRIRVTTRKRKRSFGLRSAGLPEGKREALEDGKQFKFSNAPASKFATNAPTFTTNCLPIWSTVLDSSPLKI